MCGEKSRVELQARIDELEHDFQEFVGIASHDFAGPIRRISSFLSLIVEQIGEDLDEETSQYFEFAIAGSNQLQHMLTALLTLSRVRASDQEFRAVDMGHIWQLACEQLQPQIVASKAVIKCDDLPAVMGNEAQLLTLCAALLKNAIYFAGDRAPNIHVGVDTTNVDASRRVTFAIQDGGIGIDPKFQDAVFSLFRRLQPRTGESGVGAGLTIGKRIVEHHGGRMWVESCSGPGCRFCFSLPQLGN